MNCELLIMNYNTKIGERLIRVITVSDEGLLFVVGEEYVQQRKEHLERRKYKKRLFV